MCGLAGFVSTSIIDGDTRLKNVNSIQKHRGPDFQDHRLFNLEQISIGLAHQRLSIIDLRAVSHQPFTKNERYSLVYNGEIYNFKEIREELEKEGLNFSSNGDTEVLYEALINWGIERTVSRINGMWSFAFLDLNRKKMSLCRDRIGIKPLYYYRNENSCFFASEIKGILELSQEKFPLNPDIISGYLGQHLVEQEPEETFFKNIFKLPPGHFAELDIANKDLGLKFKKYYQLQVSEAERELPYGELSHLLKDSVAKRLISDVPLGVLLSGGIDSSSLCSLANEKLEGLTTLSAVSSDARFDESDFINIMTDYLGIKQDSVSLDMKADLAFELLDRVNWHNDEPVSSFSNVSHYFLLKEAKERGLKVVLSGQGADEIFCGYKKYLGFYVTDLIRRNNLTGAAGVLLEFVRNKSIIDQFKLNEAKRYLPKFFKEAGINTAGEFLNHTRDWDISLKAGQTIGERQLEDVTQFSVPSLLHTEDRMSMAHSVEIRVPFLDHRVVEFGLNLPVNAKMYNGWTKYILRRAMEEKLPREITWRKDKQGFINPQSEWLKNELKDQVRGIFHDDQSFIYQKKIINKEQMMKKYERYISQPYGKGNISFKEIFAPLNLEKWLRHVQEYVS